MLTDKIRTSKHNREGQVVAGMQCKCQESLVAAKEGPVLFRLWKKEQIVTISLQQTLVVICRVSLTSHEAAIRPK